MQKSKPFFITRQRLAERLVMAGVEVEPCQNIYDPDRPAWKCELNRQTAEIVVDVYDEIGKQIPDVVLDVLNQ